ncbi:MAG: hypothetical protein KDC46_13555 [Thermoleophilia bacterium]|nr:hypothetical protein [Thermoleophilia bacterium]
MTKTARNRHELRESRLSSLVEHVDPRLELQPLPEAAALLEFVVRGATSGHRYGMLLVDMGHAADAIAYWRDPPLYSDPETAVAHGLSRAHAIRIAIARLELLR